VEIVGDTEGEAEKSKSLIERAWWIIPPVFIVFIYWPLVRHLGSFEYLSFESYVRQLEYFIFDEPAPIFYWSYFIFGFMAVGYYLTKNRSLVLKIIVPSILAILGSIIGGFVAITFSPSA
jgi:hypothetical protein